MSAPDAFVVAIAAAAFSVGPYRCEPVVERASADTHVPAARISRQLADGPRHAHLRFDEADFETAEEALAYAAARADYLLRFAPNQVLPF